MLSGRECDSPVCRIKKERMSGIVVRVVWKRALLVQDNGFDSYLSEVGS